MTPSSAGSIRAATVADSCELLRLWALVFDVDPTSSEPWLGRAHEWFARTVDDPRRAHFPVVDVDGEVVATAVGTLEIGVPNPQCVRGRSVRLANVVTLPEHRGRGHGTAVVLDVIAWARWIGADRVDLGATASGRRILREDRLPPDVRPSHEAAAVSRRFGRFGGGSASLDRLCTA